MDTSFFAALLKDYGLYTALGTIALLYVLKDLWSKKVIPLLVKKKKIVLKDHTAFKEFDYCIDHTLKEQFNCSCPIRKAIYRDVLIECFTCFRNYLLEFCQTNLNDKSLYPTQHDFFLKVKSVLDDAALQARQNLLYNGIPEFILNNMKQHEEGMKDCLSEILKSMCYSEYNYCNNTERMYAVLSTIIVFCKSYMDQLEELLASFNGDIKTLNYKGVVCANCLSCIHEEYLQKQKRILKGKQ